MIGSNQAADGKEKMSGSEQTADDAKESAMGGLVAKKVLAVILAAEDATVSGGGARPAVGGVVYRGGSVGRGSSPVFGGASGRGGDAR